MTLAEMNALRYNPNEEKILLGTLLRIEALQKDACRLRPSLRRRRLKKDLRAQKAAVELELSQYRQRVERLQEILDAAPDGYLRTVLRLRYEQRLTWEEVALEMVGENSASLKKRVQRYLETLP